MALCYQENGFLVPGVHRLEFEEFESLFGATSHRRILMVGLKLGWDHLRDCGCSSLYVDGSFITSKEIPNDFDACWDPLGMNLQRLKNMYPLFFDFANARKKQKEYYRGEFFPSTIHAVRNPPIDYLNFFQRDRDNNPKGIIVLN